MGNLCSSGSSHHCCCCCFCCLDEGEKVDLVLKRFLAVPASRAEDNTLQKLVGRVVLAGAPFYAPANHMPCVYYHVRVWEERIEHRTVRDSKGHTRHETHHYWHELINKEASSDFYLQDGFAKVFVQASKRELIKVQGTVDQGGEDTYFSHPPPGIAALISSHAWGKSANRTGRYKYKQASFDVNELVAALGVVQPAVDPYTGQQVKFLLPINGNILNEKFFKEQKWEPWDIESWHDLVSQSPSVLLSDDTSFTNGVQVAPIQNLPAFMVYDPNRSFAEPAAAVSSHDIKAELLAINAQVMGGAAQQPQQQPVLIVQQPQIHVQAAAPSNTADGSHMPPVIGQQPGAPAHDLNAPHLYAPAGQAQPPPPSY